MVGRCTKLRQRCWFTFRTGRLHTNELLHHGQHTPTVNVTSRRGNCRHQEETTREVPMEKTHFTCTDTVLHLSHVLTEDVLGTPGHGEAFEIGGASHSVDAMPIRKTSSWLDRRLRGRSTTRKALGSAIPTDVCQPAASLDRTRKQRIINLRPQPFKKGWNKSRRSLLFCEFHGEPSIYRAYPSQGRERAGAHCTSPCWREHLNVHFSASTKRPALRSAFSRALYLTRSKQSTCCISTEHHLSLHKQPVPRPSNYTEG